MILPIKNWQKLKRGYSFMKRTFYSSHHLGLDVVAPSMTPIYAWQDLSVTKYRYSPDCGNNIYVKCVNNKRLFRLMHLKHSVKVRKYKEGELLGYVGNTGNLSKGSHLHLDISKSGNLELNNLSNFEDPEKYFLEMMKLDK